MNFNEKVQEFLGLTGLSQAELARSVGISPAALSQVVKGAYQGDMERVKKKVLAFMQNYKKKKEVKVFIETKSTQVARFVVKKAIEHRSLALVYGGSGLGKTEVCKKICEETGNGVFLEIDAAITARSLLYKLCVILKAQGRRTLSGTLSNISEALQNREVVLFLDEVEYLNAKCLELVRRINDFTKTPIILIGTHEVLNVLQKHKQLSSRIRWAWEMKSLELEDVKKYLKQIQCEDEDVARLILNRTKGNMRDIESVVMDALELADKEGLTTETIMAALEVAFIF